jgi:hypothetical protein
VYRRCFNFCTGQLPIFLTIGTEEGLILCLDKYGICLHIPEDINHHRHCCENLKSHIFAVLHFQAALMSVCSEHRSVVDSKTTRHVVIIFCVRSLWIHEIPA